MLYHQATGNGVGWFDNRASGVTGRVAKRPMPQRITDVARLTASMHFATLLLLLTAAPFVGAQYQRRNAIVEAVAKTRDAVVDIRTLTRIPSSLDSSSGRVRGLGSGVLIDPRGYLVTNFHVVKGVDAIRVTLADGRSVPADLVRHDRASDIAVLKLQGAAARYPYLPLAGPDEAYLGETVVAIGNPYGLEQSVTTGIVSAVGRELKLPNGEVFPDLIQVSANINPGNSGGPVLTINGELLGINVAIRSNAQGIGFAIPVSHVRRIVGAAMQSRQFAPGRLGLHVESAAVGATHRAMRVQSVDPGSVAERTGFRQGDYLVLVAGQEMSHPFDLQRVFWDRNGSEDIPFRIRRDTAGEMELNLPLSALAGDLDAAAVWTHMGVRVASVPASRVRQVYEKFVGGLLVLEVRPASPAAAAGLRVGDIVVGINDYRMTEAENVRYVLEEPVAGDRVFPMVTIRDGQATNSRIRLPLVAR